MVVRKLGFDAVLRLTLDFIKPIYQYTVFNFTSGIYKTVGKLIYQQLTLNIGKGIGKYGEEK